jgi:hypothetical protein
MSGKFVITTPLASYQEFEPYTWQGDYIAGIKWALAHHGKILEKIRAGQKYTEENYSAQVLSKRFIEEVRRQLGM